jgi:phage terminase Nu1 subunit (DNA packaging protein)
MLVDSGKGGARTGAGRKKGGTNSTPQASGIFAEQKAAAILEMAEAKAKRESYMAHLAELEYKQKQGELIHVESVFKVIDTAATSCREHLMGIPGRFASIFAAEVDAMKIEQELEAEIRTALQHIADAKDRF